MEYYYTPRSYVSGTSLSIVDDEAKHLARVLRKKAGEDIFVTDGEGNLYKTKITNIAKELIDCSIIEKFYGLNEPETKITLYQSLLKNPDRFEFVIEKAVELGVYSIQPVVTENVINKTTNKADRWQSIALAAMKQSQRCVLPKIHEPINFAEALSSITSGDKLIAHEKAVSEPFTGIGISGKEVNLFIGPEGGFNDEEITAALDKGFITLNLGPRKYRSETAAIVAAAAILTAVAQLSK